MPKPIDPLVAWLVEHLHTDHREWFEERAGIVEFDGGIPRVDAERQALLMLVCEFPDSFASVMLMRTEIPAHWLLVTGVERIGAQRGVLGSVLRQHFEGLAFIEVP